MELDLGPGSMQDMKYPGLNIERKQTNKNEFAINSGCWVCKFHCDFYSMQGHHTWKTLFAGPESGTQVGSTRMPKLKWDMPSEVDEDPCA